VRLVPTAPAHSSKTTAHPALAETVEVQQIALLLPASYPTDTVEPPHHANMVEIGLSIFVSAQ
jgi:hypothetical protein